MMKEALYMCALWGFVWVLGMLALMLLVEALFIS